MDIEQIKADWKEDCKIDETQIVSASINTPMLHAKYVSILVDTKIRLSKMNNEYNTIKRKKQKYFKGEMSREELAENGWDQYQYNKPLKGELEELLLADPDVIKYKFRIDYLLAMVSLLESIMDAIKGRNFIIKNVLTWNQYLSGN